MVFARTSVKFLVFGLLQTLFTEAVPPPRNDAAVPPRTVYQWEKGSWAENIAVRSNGDLLVTLLDRPELYSVNPTKKSANLITNLKDEANAIGLLGITEMTKDVFVVVAGNFSIATVQQDPGSFSVWEVDFNRGGKCEKVKEINRLPDSSFLNGMATLDGKKKTVLISDSGLGVVWRLDTRTGEHTVVLEDDTLKPIAGVFPEVGINGLRVFQDYVYFVNSQKQTLNRVRIDLSTGEARGPYETITTGLPGDDFAISADGVAYVTTNAANGVIRVAKDGNQTVAAGGFNSTEVAGPTSAAFGRTKKDKDVVYVVTSGAQALPVNGVFSEGAKVAAIQV